MNDCITLTQEEKDFLIKTFLGKLKTCDLWFERWSTTDGKEYFDKHKHTVNNKRELCECMLIKLGFGNYDEIVHQEKRS